MLKLLKSSLAIAVLVTAFTACEKKDSNGMKKINWDRDTCVRCVMVLSYRNHTVQISNPNDGKVYNFDDIGCALTWFEEEKITWKKDAKIWIADIKSGDWLDARTAHYNTGNLTPMGYGYGAHALVASIEENEESIDFKEVQKRVISEMGKK
ncbi:hypothetical protein [Poseidonibacter lekithochrous]|uniref:hypothetical protein n=1 Tax=Poseidonibacter lekithochrous TaxID=1904463 RepID=UPI000D363FB0|nr:hypothetical protein [Poseidonibacter lekithochrous]